MEFRLEQVPPPDTAPVFPKARDLGLADGLRVEVSNSQYRCGECWKMQPRDSLSVWVPDGVRKGDPVWSVTESCREYAYNGSFTSWCVSCAKSLSAGKSGTAHTPISDDDMDALSIAMLVGCLCFLFGICLLALFT